MADSLRPRLDRLEELSKRVNTASDEAARIVQAVESHSSNTLHGNAMRVLAASACPGGPGNAVRVLAAGDPAPNHA
jgi:hypothetical protein